MKFAMYNDNQPGILTDAGVIDIGDLCPGGGQAAISHLIANYDDLKSQLETRAVEGTPVDGEGPEGGHRRSRSTGPAPSGRIATVRRVPNWPRKNCWLPRLLQT